MCQLFDGFYRVTIGTFFIIQRDLAVNYFLDTITLTFTLLKYNLMVYILKKILL